MIIKVLSNPNLGQTSESVAAQKLSDMLSSSIPDEVEGQIIIAPNVKLLGQQIRDIDLVVWGNLSNYKLQDYYVDESGVKKNLLIKDFFVIIDLKSHPADKVSCQDSHVLVAYSGIAKDITTAIEQQRYSMLEYLKANNINIIVSNAIWFDSITKDELVTIIPYRGLCALPNEFVFKDFIATIIAQGNKPVRDLESDCYVLSTCIDSEMFNRKMQNLLKLW